MQNNTGFLSTFKKYKNFIFIFFGIAVFLVSKNYGMFWDNVLFASKMGTHLYENSLFNWNIPNSFDPGHPPFLGFLLAVFWKIFGYNLWVSHLLMLPFIIGFLYQLYEFVSYFVKKEQFKILAFLLLIANPTVAASFVLVNPEIIILFFFFLAINGLLKQKYTLKFIGLFFLSIVSYRSMMLFAGIFLFDVLNNLFINRKKIKTILNLNFLLFYFSASIPAFLFVSWRLATKGWLQTHPDSPWVGLWQFASLKVFFKNCVVLVWQYLDFGRIFIFLFIIISFFFFGKKIVKPLKNKELLLLSICSVLSIVVVSLLATNSFGQRYFLVSYVGFILLSFLILIENYKSKKIIYAILFFGLISGNLWVYPKKIPQGWDATLAHIPYHSLRLKAIKYLDSENIKIENVATFFPNINTIHNIDLSKDQRKFASFNDTKKYAFYSNVYNLSDENLNKLEKEYTVLKQFNNFNINITIYTLKEK